ncbi:iojap-like protein [Desulfosarcina variabilis str. Montpellier]|uniref:ribosome silencing factor n=1 Tax=Desulfosarcina variabilis TaxID=2300 RepID=UPI003AFB5EAC
MNETIDPDLDIYVKAVLGKKARNPVLLDVHHLTSLADAFLICHGTSNRQVSAIAEHVQRDLKKQGIKPLSVDGIKEGHWVLMDYGHIIIHVFFEETRGFYNLESLWSDARRIQTESLRHLDDYPEDTTDTDVDESVFIE